MPPSDGENAAPSGDADGESRRPNPEAIAWYVGQAEALLSELRSRVQSLRMRAGQIAGFSAAVIALVGSNAERIFSALADVSAQEVANYATERFTHEPDLWRIHIRTIGGLLDSIDSTTQMVDRASATLRAAGFLFLMGLLGVAAALGILILEVTF